MWSSGRCIYDDYTMVIVMLFKSFYWYDSLDYNRHGSEGLFNLKKKKRHIRRWSFCEAELFDDDETMMMMKVLSVWL